MTSLSEVNREDVTDQLTRILNSPVFNNSLLLSGFLRFIVEETIAARGVALKEYTIGVAVLSKNTGYDPQTDASVRIHAGRLRRALYNYYNGPGCHDTILISVPKGSYVPKFESIIPSATQEDIRVPIKPTLAIIPFNCYEDSKLSVLADSLCDQICTEFTNFNELAVVSYYSSKKIFPTVSNLKEIALLLDAKYLLTGTIQSIETKVRVRVQLVQGSNLHQIWASTYEKMSALDTFSIQDDIVRRVVNQIAGTHGIIFREAAKISPGQRVMDIKVYDAVFWYYYLVSELNEEIFAKGLASMQEAVRLDSQYALGWAILGETYVAGIFNNFNCHLADPIAEAIKCAKMAIQIDHRCHHAYQTLALAHLFQRKKKECIHIVNEWLKLKSEAGGIKGGLGACLIFAGDYERGYSMLTDSIYLNPYYPWWFNTGLSVYHFYKRDCEEVIYWSEKIHNHSPDWELILKTAACSETGRFEESKIHLAELGRLMDMSKLPFLLSAFLQDEDLIHRIKTAIEKVAANELNINRQ